MSAIVNYRTFRIYQQFGFFRTVVNYSTHQDNANEVKNIDGSLFKHSYDSKIILF